MFWLTNLKREDGYTFIEMLFQLVITSLVITSILLIFYWKSSLEQQFNSPTATSEWELFSMTFQQLLEGVQHVSLQNNRRTVRIDNEQERLDVDFYQTILRKRVNQQGHVPLLTNVELVTFQLDSSAIHIMVERLDGTMHERSFAIDYLVR